MFPTPVGKRGVRPFDEVWVFTKGGLVNVNMQSTVHTVICMVSPNPRRLVPRTASYRPGDSTAARAAPICLGGMPVSKNADTSFPVDGRVLGMVRTPKANLSYPLSPRFLGWG